MSTITLAVQGVIDPALREYSPRILHLGAGYGDRLDGLEIGFFLHRLEQDGAALDSGSVQDVLAGFSWNTVHVVARAGVPVEESHVIQLMAKVNSLYETGLVRWVSFHLDMQPWFETIAGVASPGLCLLWENLDADAKSGKSLEEALNAVEQFPKWEVVLDVAHVMETASQGGASLDEWVAAIGGKVRQVHLSWPENLYSEEIVGPSFDTRHSFVHLKQDAVTMYAPILQKMPSAVVTLEGVVPSGAVGRAMLLREISAVRRMSCAE